MKFILLVTLLGQIGISEPHPRIEDYLASTGLDGDYAWCASFVEYNLNEIGLQGTGSAVARSYLHYGKKVSEPRLLDLVVLWRESRSSWKGHIGFYIGMAQNGNVLLLGGNQGDSVSIKEYPRHKILGSRRAVE